MYNGNTKRKREKGIEEIFKVSMAQNFPKLVTNTKPQIQQLRVHDAGKIPKVYTKATNKEKEKNFEGKHKAKLFHLLKNKDKSYIRPLFRVMQARRQW